MIGTRTFVDTNVLTCLFDDGEPEKQALAGERLRAEQAQKELVVSTQVLQELYASLTQGQQPIATPDIAEQAVRHAAELTVVHIDVVLVLEAIARCREHSLSFWDSLIVGAASASGCTVLLSEDLNHGQLFGNVRVVNPFQEGEP
ncbi:MAG TPA: PIN domain-containing protein [Polyangiaceae bacterium]|jgi:predicted nucleic acid-binding protein|nr:PIN domain-containing protein [Polyangiaceae bacterium]